MKESSFPQHLFAVRGPGAQALKVARPAARGPLVWLPLWSSVLLWGLILLPAALGAEVIQLKSGEMVDGRIVTQDEKRIVIKTAAGQRVISKKAIRRIVYDPGMGQRLVAAEKRKAEAERQKVEDARRAREAADRRKAEEAERRKAQAEAERERAASLKERQAREARAQYALLAEEYQRQVQAERERLAGEDQHTPPDSTDDERVRQFDRWGALWRSALVPGWGQFYAGSPVAGSIYGGLFAVAAGDAYSQRRLTVSARSAYSTFTDTSFLLPFLPGAGMPVVTAVYLETGRYSRTYRRAVLRQQQSIYLLGGIYLTQLLHAAFLRKEIDTATLLSPEGDGGLLLSLSPREPVPGEDAVLGAGPNTPDTQLRFGYALRF